MDRYAEMLTEIEHSDHPLQTIQTLQRMVCTVCEAGPAREGILWAASFLAALADYRNPRQLSLLTDYSEAAEAMNYVIADVQQEMEAAWALWRADLERKQAEQEKEDWHGE